MRRFITLIFFLFALSEIFGQRPSIALTFSAVNNTVWVQLDSIKVMNRTQDGDTVLYYPDTVLVLDYQVGIPEPHKTVEGFQVFQNYPNPVADQTTINVYVPSKDNVSITLTDVLGRVIIRSEHLLDEGLHSFKLIPGNGSIFFFTAQWKGCNSSIKILQAYLSANGECSLEYLGSEPSSHKLKVAEDIHSFPFSLGDGLLYIGYTDTLQSGMLDSPESSESYTFQFATNIPCPGTPTVEYEEQVYNTIQIFSQCWFKENLNVGTMIQGNINMHNDGISEKYCYSNIEDSCTIYGGLYQWNEIMQYTQQEAVQGICPPGWHIPTDEEWKVLEGAVDSQYRIGDPLWDTVHWRGFDAGLNLKSKWGWVNQSNGLDWYGFSVIPAGLRSQLGNFFSLGLRSTFWSSTMYSPYSIYYRLLFYDHEDISRSPYHQETGFSVRCLKDD